MGGESDSLLARYWSAAPWHCRLEFKAHVGSRTLSRALICRDPAAKTRPCRVSLRYWPSFRDHRRRSHHHHHRLHLSPLLLPSNSPTSPPPCFFHPRGKEISLSRASWAREGFAGGARTHFGSSSRQRRRRFEKKEEKTKT